MHNIIRCYNNNNRTRILKEQKQRRVGNYINSWAALITAHIITTAAGL